MNQEFAVRRRQSDELAQAGEWGPKAEAINTRLIELAPSWTVAYTRLAKCLSERGDMEGAQRMYRRVLAIDPDNVIAKNHFRQTHGERSTMLEGTASTPNRQPTAPTHRPTVQVAAASPDEEGLAFFHQRLAAHFEFLQARRAALAPGKPIFALEHGLADSELTVLRQVVQTAARRGHLSRLSWLPFVVYAAEIGYEYSGDEYWPIFEDRTPGWRERGDRNYIRDKFWTFQQTYSGAKPTGSWAEQFSIICWPITHAVLPTDLQVHLARILFEYRRVYTSDLLADPSELGKRLASRAWQTSSRFRNFAQNTDLLGHVAAAMLLAADEPSDYLLDTTLRRIVADLEREKQAKRWLYHARRHAGEVRTSGLHSTEQPITSAETPPRQAAVRLPTSTDPSLSVRREGNAWVVLFEVPDLSVLADRLPTLTQELARMRARISGYGGAPLARGQLLFPGRQIRLNEWPGPAIPLIQLEDGSAAANSLLAEQCVLSPGPPWLFRTRESGFGVEIHGKFCRPGCDYLLLTTDTVTAADDTQWVATTACTAEGVNAYMLNMPATFGPAELSTLQRLGLGAVTGVDVKPAGFVPALWDGEGLAEWIDGDEPIVAVASNHTIDKAFLTLDGQPVVIPWPAGAAEIFVRLDDLDVGSHELRCSLLPAERDKPIVDGVLDIIIRSPLTRPSAGTYREGLMILPTPANPTLAEVWDGRATLEVRGPAEVEVTAALSLMDRAHRVLGEHSLTTSIPIDSSRWPELLATVREANAIHRAYESAELAEVSVSHPSLGTVSLTCEREFAPLRWAPGSDRDGPYVRLVDNTESPGLQVEIRGFVHPDQWERIDLDEHSCIRRAGGGLVRAQIQGIAASVILPPTVRNLSDLQSLNVHPSIADGNRSVAGVRRIIQLANEWEVAALPADPFAARQKIRVLRSTRAHLAGLIGGENWSRLERACTDGPIRLSAAQIQNAVGGRPNLTGDLVRRPERFREWSSERRVQFLAGLLASHRQQLGSFSVPFHATTSRPPETRFAEFLLRLASAPETVLDWPSDEVDAAVRVTLDLPLLFRLARLLVLEMAGASADTGAAYEGWVWD